MSPEHSSSAHPSQPIPSKALQHMHRSLLTLRHQQVLAPFLVLRTPQSHSPSGSMSTPGGAPSAISMRTRAPTSSPMGTRCILGGGAIQSVKKSQHYCLERVCSTVCSEACRCEGARLGVYPSMVEASIRPATHHVVSTTARRGSCFGASGTQSLNLCRVVRYPAYLQAGGTPVPLP